LHATSQTQDQVKGRLLLDVIVRESASIFQLFASKDQTLLIWRNAFFILNLGFDIFNGVRRLHFQSDCFASQCFDKNLHATSQTQDQVKGRLLLDVIVRQGTTIFQLLTSKDQTLLIWGNTLFILNLGFDILNGVRRFHFKSDCFASQGLDENLHATTETENQMQGGFLLNVIVRKSATIF